MGRTGVNEPTDHRQYVYVGGALVMVCVCARSVMMWRDQKGCQGSVENKASGRCYWNNSKGECEIDICHEEKS